MNLVDEIRAFNRSYTREIGLLAEHLPQSDLSLARARVLYELAQPGERTAADIIRSLGMDKAHVSRIVTSFRAAGFLRSRLDPAHGKHKLLSLTALGRKTFRQLNQGTVSQIEALIAPIGREDRRRLSMSMRQIQEVLGKPPAAANAVRLRSLRPGDIGWVTHRHGVLYASEYGWDWTFEGLVARILADFSGTFDAAREDGWIAELGETIVGSIFLMKTDDERIARLRLLYVEPTARGLRIGSLLVRTCVERARALGYGTLVLWTNDVLVAARRIYQAAGFALTDQHPHRSFGKELTGQTWTLDLAEASSE